MSIRSECSFLPPSGWESVKLGTQLKKVVGGGTPSRKINEYWHGDIPWATVKDLVDYKLDSTQESITEKGLRASSTNLIPADTVVLATRMAVGKTAMFSCDIAINQDLKALFPRSSLRSDYLLHWSVWMQREMERLGSGSTVKGIGLSLLRNQNLLLPPLPEQKKIAAILSSVDETIQATRETIEQTKKVKQGLMQKLLTRGIGHTKFKKTEIGEIPEEWKPSKLDRLIDVKAGKGFKLSEYCNDGYKLLRIDNVSWGRIKWETVAYLPEEYATQYPELVLKPDDILLALNRPITQGKLKLAKFNHSDHPAILYQRVGRIRTRDPLDQGFAYYLLGYFLISFIQNESVGSDQPFINITKLREAKIPIPPISEQLEISGILSSAEKSLQEEEANLQQLQLLKKGLMQDLLTGRVRVNVV